MAQFPSTPNNGDQTTINGITYTYNSTKTAWIRNSATGANLTANSLTLTASSSSTSTTTGALVVTGGAGIQGNLYVAALYAASGVFTGPTSYTDQTTVSGNLVVSGPATFSGTVQLNNITAAPGTTSLSGTTTVSGTFTYNSGTVLTTVSSPYLGANSIIRTNSNTINEDITIPSGTNGVSAGPITIASGRTVTVNGDWSIV